MRAPAWSSRRLAAAVAGAFLAAGWGWLSLTYQAGDPLRRASYDLLVVARGPRPVHEAVLVYLDEESHRQLGQPLNAPFDRGLHAQLIERLTRAGARAVVFDIVFSDANPDKPAADARLVAAVKANGRVVLGADSRPSPSLGGLAKSVDAPFPALLDAAAGFGSVELQPSTDLVVREHTLEDRRFDQIPSLSWAAAAVAGAPATQRAELRYASKWIDYYGPPHFLPSKNFFQALDPAQVGDDYFRDRTVFIGSSLMTQFVGDRKDEYCNPYSGWLPGRPFMAGVEIQATLFLNLLRGDWLTRLSRAAELAILLPLGLLWGAGLTWFRPTRATAAAVGGVLLVALGALAAFSWGRLWFPWLLLATQIGIGLFWSVLFNSVQLYVQKRLQQQTLEMYLPPALVDKFARNPALLKPGAEEQEITIFFSDIADFTALSQQVSSQELATLMNRYFETAVAQCIHATDGTVVKFIGDAIFAFWNAPDPQADHPARACEAALRFRRLLPLEVRGQPLRTRMGIHTGRARVGNFGSMQRVDYTAFGESVNLASRLEGLNKFLGTECLLSRATCDRLGDRMVVRGLGHFQLKGFANTVEVFELVGWPEEAASSQPWRDAFAQALENFETRNLELAEAGFRRVLELRPQDVPSKFYLQRIVDLGQSELPHDWVTHTIVREK